MLFTRQSLFMYLVLKIIEANRFANSLHTLRSTVVAILMDKQCNGVCDSIGQSVIFCVIRGKGGSVCGFTVLCISPSRGAWNIRKYV